MRAWQAALLAVLVGLPLPAQAAQSFADFLSSFEPKAVAAGVTSATYERATAGLIPDPNIPKLVSTQPEFDTPIWDYLDRRISDSRVTRGKAAMAANAARRSCNEDALNK